MEKPENGLETGAVVEDWVFCELVCPEPRFPPDVLLFCVGPKLKWNPVEEVSIFLAVALPKTEEFVLGVLVPKMFDVVGRFPDMAPPCFEASEVP